MPSTSASMSSARSSSSLVVDLDQHVEVERARLAVQVGEVVVVERGDDQQDRVGAGRRRLVELVGVDDEVLAQDRQVGGRARRLQVLERAAEVRLLGEDRDRRGAAALVGADDARRRVAPSRIVPADGERRLCSAITEMPGRGERLAERATLGALVERRLEVGRAASAERRRSSVLACGTRRCVRARCSRRAPVPA